MGAGREGHGNGIENLRSAQTLLEGKLEFSGSVPAIPEYSARKLASFPAGRIFCAVSAFGI